ncbi:hypothetical protein KM427_11320 [Nocardioides sp. LMS-CY]|uniref:hypothetical protein n=1 Tax=Nocardioides sp. (strain LMS-CY) TaxID=2840457 RepID=UPI001BFFF5F4|nr:hypothetical protein [Nocardioides sp. LMS-CY]QWF24221.1 hypothetical protein KM427_11320 [Nocardioides sp. LMS-CY]
MLGSGEIDMTMIAGIGARIGGWGRRSNEGARTNAREASTTLSRTRVEREEVELYLRTRYAGPVRHEPISDVTRPA